MTDDLDVPLDALLGDLGSVQNRPHAVLNAAVFPSERGDQRPGRGPEKVTYRSTCQLSKTEKSLQRTGFERKKSVWAFWLIGMRAVYSGALRGVREDQGYLVPICVAWQEKKSQKLSWFHLLGWKSKAEWEFVFSRL